VRAAPWLPFASVLLAGAHAAAADFYARDAEGWFWYDDPRIVIEEPEEPAPPAPATPLPVPAPPAHAEAPATPPAPAGPPPLSAAWMRENLDRYRDAALDSPTPENVELYFLLQKVALDKAERFADVSQRVIVGHAALDEVARRPITNLGANIANRVAGDNRDAVLSRVARIAAIWFFYRSDCPYCEAQAPLLELLEKHSGFTVLAISVDGLPMPSGLYPDFVRDAGQAEFLGATTTPSMFLVHPETGAVSALGRGMLSLAELRERIVIAAVRAGWITEDESDTVSPVAGRPTLTGVSPDAPDDPEALLAYLKARERDRRRQEMLP
jgi:conjugal transfer pilus assembly protein TraF